MLPAVAKIFTSPRREPSGNLSRRSCQGWASAPELALEPRDASSASKPSPGKCVAPRVTTRRSLRNPRSGTHAGIVAESRSMAVPATRRVRSNERDNDRPTFAIHESFVLTEDYSDQYDAQHRFVSNYLC